MRKLESLLLISLLSTTMGQFTALATISVGVKEGDWIEYQVEYIGTPPKGHDVIWAKMEVLEVRGAVIPVRITSKLSSQQQESQTTALNLETGHLIDAFVIPANLAMGESFLDENRGLMTINGSQKKTVAGAERTVVYVAIPETTTYWDRETGVAVEGYAALANFTMVTKARQTNMWNPVVVPQDATIHHLLLAVVLTALFIMVAWFFLRRKKVEDNPNSLLT